MNKRVYDVSMPISADTPRWPGSIRYSLKSEKNITSGGLCNETSLTMGVHFGTHIDAPLHFIEDGSSVDMVALDVLVGDACLVDMSGVDRIMKRTLEAADIPIDCKRLLIKTDNSKLLIDGKATFNENYVALDITACEWIVEKGIQLVGIDYLSIESFNADYSVHKYLLSNDVVILEGLKLNEIHSDNYELICLPMKIMGAEAAPARVLLRK
jgi:arylformamidase